MAPVVLRIICAIIALPRYVPANVQRATTMIARSAQKHQMMMVGNLSDLNENFSERISSLSHAFGQVDLSQGILMAKSTLYNQLLQQARLWGYIDTFRVFALACLLIIPIIALIKSPRYNK